MWNVLEKTTLFLGYNDFFIIGIIFSFVKDFFYENVFFRYFLYNPKKGLIADVETLCATTIPLLCCVAQWIKI